MAKSTRITCPKDPPDVLERAAVLQARVEAVNRDFAKRYGWDEEGQRSQAEAGRGQTLEQSDPYYDRGRTVRGQFQPAGPGVRPLITPFRSANPSTALHELSHSWLEELRRDAEGPNATEQLKADWAYIRQWACVMNGVTDAARATGSIKFEFYTGGATPAPAEGENAANLFENRCYTVIKRRR